MRLIDADALIETINLHCYPVQHDINSIEPGMTQIGILQAIQEQPTIEPQQWIPVSERLPEEAYGRYWVCTDTGYQCQCRWTDDVYGLGSSGEWAWKIFDIPQYSHVIAWMPLPKPYKENKDERD